VLPFIGAQIVGALIGWGIATIFTRFPQKETALV
jgi:hypothetical protein